MYKSNRMSLTSKQIFIFYRFKQMLPDKICGSRFDIFLFAQLAIDVAEQVGAVQHKRNAHNHLQLNNKNCFINQE
jgi:hypothetical protein